MRVLLAVEGIPYYGTKTVFRKGFGILIVSLEPGSFPRLYLQSDFRVDFTNTQSMHVACGALEPGSHVRYRVFA